MPNAKHLVNEFAIEWYSERTEKQSRVFIGGRSSVEGDVTTRDHFDRVPIHRKLLVSI
jgi:hypothetical protein